MATEFRITVDAMGGDNAPANEVAGAILASERLSSQGVKHTICLLGNADRIKAHFRTRRHTPTLVIEHTEEVVTMDDDPSTVIRAKPNSSLVRGIDHVRSGKSDAFISAGNTGAVLSAATLLLGRIRGVSRPTIGAFFPTMSGTPCLLVDVGANTEVRPQFLYQFAIMGSLYTELVGRVHSPRVGLLNIGEEKTKGTETIRQAYELLSNKVGNFVGNVEGRDIFAGHTDVVVCDGFTGNIILKFAESIMPMLSSVLRRYSKRNILTAIVVSIIAPFLRRALRDFDYQQYGGVPLLGVRGIVIIGHGKSTPLAISNMIMRAWEAYSFRLNERIEQTLAQTTTLTTSNAQ